MKRLLAVLLGVCLAAALLAPAASALECDCGGPVEIVVKGYMHPLYYNEGKWYQMKAGPIAHIAVNRYGKSILPVTKTWKLDPSQDHKTDSAYEFLYDYRIDPFEAAALLNDFIHAVCAHTGHQKVALVGTSYGANVVMTYLSQYGTDRLETFLLINGTFQGTSFAGDIMTGSFGYSATAYINFIEALGVSTWFTNLLRKIPFVNLELPMGPAAKAIFRVSVLKWVRNIPSLWSFLPAAYYDEAIQLLADYPDQTWRRELLDKYVNEVQSQAKTLLLGAQEAGVKVALIASYGKAPVPLMGDTSYQSDMMVDLVYASGGATVAPMGKTLPPGDPRYRSPDDIIDASTCMLPDHTWFIADNKHKVGGTTDPIRQWIIRGENPNIAANPAFPQFLRRVDDFSTEPLVKP